MGLIEQIPYHVLACCVLHNICLIKNNDFEILMLNDNIEAIHSEEVERCNRVEAEAKRNFICATHEKYMKV